jgi:hypothetical protein
VPLAGWNPETSDEDEPTIPYNVEWKLSINHRRRAGESEPGIDVSPRNFWKHTLQPKLVKASAKKPCQVDDTEIVMSTTHRKTRPLTGKNCNVTTITITFFYTYVGTSKPPKGSATTNQLGEIQARIGDGPVLSQGACIRKAFALMRCPGPPCRKGGHCWIHGKHHPLHPHHVRLKILADHLQAGKPLNGYDDVPETFRRLVLDDEREERGNGTRK